ncbi:MAG: hypothetical protein AAF585_06430, partial [Verrucomicrobiota bacterium]
MTTKQRIWIGVLALAFPAAAGAQSPAPHWIWTDSQEDKVAHFRFEFEVPADLTRAVLSATGDDGYALYVNGQRIGRGATDTGWEKIDINIVTDKVKKGEVNSIAVRAENNGGSGGFIGLVEL